MSTSSIISRACPALSPSASRRWGGGSISMRRSIFSIAWPAPAEGRGLLTPAASRFMARWTVNQFGRTARRGRQALTARISGWPRSRYRIIPGVAGFPELRCGFRVSSRARKGGGLRLGLHERTAARLCSARALRRPVSPAASAWWMSVGCAARNLLRAASIELCGEVQLPALRLTVAEILDALSGLFGPNYRALVSFKPDARIEALFGRYPELATAQEEALGFVHDGTPVRLLKEALAS